VVLAAAWLVCVFVFALILAANKVEAVATVALVLAFTADVPAAMAAAKLVDRGVERILVLPYFLTLGLHMERDLPRLTEDISNRYKGVEVLVGLPLEGHPALVKVLLDRSLSILRSRNS